MTRDMPVELFEGTLLMLLWGLMFVLIFTPTL